MKSKILGLLAVGLLLCAAMLGQPPSAAAATLVDTDVRCVYTGTTPFWTASASGCWRLIDVQPGDPYVVRDPGTEFRLGPALDVNFLVDVGPDFVRVTYNGVRANSSGTSDVSIFVPRGPSTFLGFWIEGLSGVTGASLSSLSTTTSSASKFTFFPNGTSEVIPVPTLFMDLTAENWTTGKFAQVDFTFDTGTGPGGGGGNGGGSGTAVPEPGTLALLSLGLAGLGLSRRRTTIIRALRGVAGLRALAGQNGRPGAEQRAYSAIGRRLSGSGSRIGLLTELDKAHAVSERHTDTLKNAAPNSANASLSRHAQKSQERGVILMGQKFVGLLVVALFAAPAGAGVVFTIDTETELRGMVTVTGFEGLTRYQPNAYTLGTDSSCTQLQSVRISGLLGFGAVCPFSPSNPWLVSSTPAVDTTFADIVGSYSLLGEDGSGGPTFNAVNYFRMWGMRDTGGEGGTFSGNFCFSTNAATCAQSVPEPGTLALLGLGLAGLGLSRRRNAA